MLSALVPALPFLWLGIFFLAPFAIVLKISLSDPAVAQPPYRPLFAWSDLAEFFSQLDLENFTTLVGRRSLSVGDALVGPHRRHLDRAVVADGLSDRLRNGARARATSRIAGRAGHPAVLDELPDPHLCVDGDPEARRLLESGPDRRSD